MTDDEGRGRIPLLKIEPPKPWPHMPHMPDPDQWKHVKDAQAKNRAKRKPTTWERLNTWRKKFKARKPDDGKP